MNKLDLVKCNSLSDLNEKEMHDTKGGFLGELIFGFVFGYIIGSMIDSD